MLEKNYSDAFGSKMFLILPTQLVHYKWPLHSVENQSKRTGTMQGQCGKHQKEKNHKLSIPHMNFLWFYNEHTLFY